LRSAWAEALTSLPVFGSLYSKSTTELLPEKSQASLGVCWKKPFSSPVLAST
jgi:hypothetical protein